MWEWQCAVLRADLEPGFSETCRVTVAFCFVTGAARVYLHAGAMECLHRVPPSNIPILCAPLSVVVPTFVRTVLPHRVLAAGVFSTVHASVLWLWWGL